MKKQRKDKFYPHIWRVTPAQKKWVKQQAKESKLSEAGIIRNLIDTAISVQSYEE